MSHDEFTGADASSSHTYPARCSSLRKGGHVILNNRPCKIVDISTAKPGKHGHAKIRLVGLDLFTKRKYEGLSPSTHNMDVPTVKKKDYQVIGVGVYSDELTLMNDRGELHRVPLPSDDALKHRIKEKYDNEEDFLVTLLIAMDDVMVVAIKEMNPYK